MCFAGVPATVYHALFRIHCKDAANLCYDDTDLDLRCCKVMQVAMSQTEFAKGVQHLLAVAATLACRALLQLLSPVSSVSPIATCKLAVCHAAVLK